MEMLIRMPQLLPTLATDFSFLEFTESIHQINEDVSTVAEPAETQDDGQARLSEFFPRIYPLVRRALWLLQRLLTLEVADFRVWRREGRTEELKELLLADRRLLEIFFVIPFDAVDSSSVKSFIELALLRAVENSDLDMVAVWISEVLIHYTID